ncbi:hypothetical protein [Vibrio owensii]|uniref:hypothetical protein n=1 Tax=Vibrio harveyi group TaxID=717610 RepID=UPI003CC5D4F0
MNILKKQFLVAATLFALTPIANAGYYDIEIRPDQPAVGVGKALFAEDTQHVWISLQDDLPTFERMVKASTSNNINEEFSAIRVNLYGINSEEYRHSKNQKVRKVWTDAFTFVKAYMNDTDVKFYCPNTARDGAPTCAVEVIIDEKANETVNINAELLARGLSKLDDSEYKSKALNKSLQIYETTAKRANAGVWREMFSLFEM